MKVYTGDAANKMNAKAFTQGENIFFKTGEGNAEAQQELLKTESDKYFGEIYQELKKELIKRGANDVEASQKLSEIFGTLTY